MRESCIEKVQLRLGLSILDPAANSFLGIMYTSSSPWMPYEVQFHQKSILSTPFVGLRQLALRFQAKKNSMECGEEKQRQEE